MIDSFLISRIYSIHLGRSRFVSRQAAPVNLYNNTRMTTHESTRESHFYTRKSACANRHHTSWYSGILSDKGWSSDFIRALQSVNVIERSSMAFMLRSHNGVHCCGTVGDSHSHSQLSTAKCTFTGDSFQNHGGKDGANLEPLSSLRKAEVQPVLANSFAKLRIFSDITINLMKKSFISFSDSNVRNN